MKSKDWWTISVLLAGFSIGWLANMIFHAVCDFYF